MIAALVRWLDAMMAARIAARPWWIGEPAPRVICAWCPTWNPRDPANVGASHGLCRRCERRLRAELDAADAIA